MDWIDVADPEREQKIAARIAVCRSFLAVQAFGPFAQRIGELGLRAKREKGAMVTYVPIVLVPRVLEILPPAALAWVKEKSNGWMEWIAKEEGLHARRSENREGLAPLIWERVRRVRLRLCLSQSGKTSTLTSARVSSGSSWLKGGPYWGMTWGSGKPLKHWSFWNRPNRPKLW